MKRKFLFTCAILSAISFSLLAAPGDRGDRGPGGGGFGGFGGMRGWGGFGNRFREADRYDPKRLAEAADRKVKKYVEDGWVALRVGDVPAAFDAFMDALDMSPENVQAKFGLAYARAAKGDFSRAQTEFEAAGRLKVDPRLVAYNIAVTWTRLGNDGRALVLLNRQMNELKPLDEIIFNAQASVLMTLDDKQKKSIAVLSDMHRSLGIANQLLASTKHAGKERWGLFWMLPDQVQKLRDAKEKESYPAEIPFLLPGDHVLPEKGAIIAANPLLPEQLMPDMPAVASTDPAAPKKPDVEPIIIAKRDDNAPFRLGGGSGPADGGLPAPKPITKTDPDPTVVSPNPKPAIAASPVIRTVRGAAFAISNDMLLTSARLLQNAREIQLQGTDGKVHTATLVASDEQAGVALIKVSGVQLSPMPMADAPRLGAVGIAAFARPAVFSPVLELLKAELTGAPGKMLLRCSVHPRSAGSPIVDDKGLVLGIMIASRDDAPDKLPVITVDVIRKFAEGKFTAATSSAGEPDDSVLEMIVTRQE